MLKDEGGDATTTVADPWLDTTTNTIINAGVGVPAVVPASTSVAATSGSLTVPSSQDFINVIKASPELAQANQNIQLWADQQKANAAFEAEWTQKFYEQNRAQLASSGGGGGSSGNSAALKAAEEVDKLQKEKAAHDLANMQEQSKETLGSRGLGSSGQAALEQGELKYSYEMLLKEIDANAKARRASAAAAASSSSSSNANAIADLDLRYQYELAKQGQFDTQLATEIALKQGDALLQVANDLKPYYFGSDGVYRDANGLVQLTTTQAAATTSSGLASSPIVQQPVDSLTYSTNYFTGGY